MSPTLIQEYTVHSSLAPLLIPTPMMRNPAPTVIPIYLFLQSHCTCVVISELTHTHLRKKNICQLKYSVCILFFLYLELQCPVNTIFQSYLDQSLFLTFSETVIHV